MKNNQEHWDDIYSKSEINTLGWFEEIPQSSIELIEKCNLSKSSHILDVGSGASTLTDYFLRENYINITALDISSAALEASKKRMEPELAARINWVVDDITNPKNLQISNAIDLWHDRTVLHFLTKEDKQIRYLATLKRFVKRGGYVIIAVFALEGAKKCSGLDVKNYDHNMISEFLGNDFILIEHFLYTYIQPTGGERPYTYTLFQRKNI